MEKVTVAIVSGLISRLLQARFLRLDVDRRLAWKVQVGTGTVIGKKMMEIGQHPKLIERERQIKCRFAFKTPWCSGFSANDLATDR